MISNVKDIFDKCASNVSKCRNKKFTGKSDVMLYRGKQNIVDAREAAWTDIQKKKMEEKIKEKMKKAANVNIILTKLVQDCKS